LGFKTSGLGKMTIEASLAPSGQRYRVRTKVETDRAFLRAERHSKRVVVLRKVLPALAVLVLASYFISSSLSVSVGDVTASISGVQVTDGALRMTNPKLQGADKKNGAYIISAEYADQDLKNPNIIRLHAIKADLSNPSGDWSRMEAVRGVFNSKAERLVMQDKITIATSSGVTGELTHASLDTKAQTLRSHQRVHFELTHGTVKANALTFNSGEHTLTFRGRVLVHIIKPEQAADAKPADAKPRKAKTQAPQASDSAPADDTAPDTTGAAPEESAVPPLPALSQ
jgi:lipopolysaccharide export system protein LptC